MNEKTVESRVIHAVERAEVPYILFARDVALRFQIEEDRARWAIERGLLGPWFSVDGKPAVLREQLTEHLRVRMVQTSPEDREVLQ